MSHDLPPPIEPPTDPSASDHVPDSVANVPTPDPTQPERAGASSSSGAMSPTDYSAPLTPLERWSTWVKEPTFHPVAGAIGGFTSGIVTCPLDVIKTKLQAQGGFNSIQKGRHVGHHQVYKGLIGTARTITSEEGVRGLYRGLGPIVMGYLPTWAVYFALYNKSKDSISQYSDNFFVVNVSSSVIAGASSTLVTNPIWVIKTRLMSQTPAHSRHAFSHYPKGANTPTSRPTLAAPWHYNSTLDAARKMYTTEGIASFYSGLTPALLGLTHVAVQFPAYEYLKTKFTGQGMGDAPTDDKKHPGHWFGVLGATVLSKILASSATYPHEVIRTRLQTQRRPSPGVDAKLVGQGNGGNGANPKYRGVTRTFKTILAEEGWRAFYAGMGTNMMRAVPAATVTMLTYELVMAKLKKARVDGQGKIEWRQSGGSAGAAAMS